MTKDKMLQNVKSVCGSESNEYMNMANVLEKHPPDSEIVRYLYKQILRFQKSIDEINLERFSRNLKLINKYLYDLEWDEEYGT